MAKAKPKAGGKKIAGTRAKASEGRRQAILDAGLEVFAESGFSSARLDDVAAKAGVAKGTIYLSFKDKEDLFEQIVVGAVTPVLLKLEAMAGRDDISFDKLIQQMIEVFRAEVLATNRKKIIYLVITEGARFPRIAAFYHREVVAKGTCLIAELARRAVARGELSSNSLARYPQLVVAPLLMLIIWDNVFSRIEPLDIEGLLAAHCRLLLGDSKRRRK